MKRLILMRHAKSDWSTATEDHARPLNARGVQSAPAMGRWVQQHGWQPDEVLCSTAARTRETLELLALPETPTQFTAELYLTEASEMMNVLKGANGTTVLMIGHNHGIAQFAHRLVSDWPEHPRFADYPTCATSIITFDIDDWAELVPETGNCEAFGIPREVLRAEGID